MEPYRLKQQQKRLAEVSKQQWRDILEKVTRHMTGKLHAALLTGKDAARLGGNPEGMLVGGNTKTGAHSELELGGNALQHYQGGAVTALYRGEEEWVEGTDLAKTLMDIVDKLMKDEVKAYKKRHKLINLRAEDDVETMPEAKQPPDEEDQRTEQLQKVWDAVEGEPELEQYVEALSHHKKLDGVCAELGGISKRDADNLRKRVIRRTKRIKGQL